MPQSTARSLDLAPEMGPSKPNEPEVWSPRHALVCRLIGAGLTNKEVALATGFSEVRVSELKNDPRAKRFILEASKRVADNILDLNSKLKHHAYEALEEIVDQLRESRDEKVRQKAAFGILDRAGYTPLQRHQITEAPKIPSELADTVREAHMEMKEIVRTVKFSVPASQGRDLNAIDEPLDSE